MPISITGPNVNDYTWTWNPTTFLSASNTYSALASPPGMTTYTVTGTPTSPCASPTPLQYVFVVKPLGTLPTTISSNAPICVGSTLSLTANGGAFYSWTGPNGFTSAVQSPTIANVQLASAGIYTAVITNTAGCSATTTRHIRCRRRCGE